MEKFCQPMQGSWLCVMVPCENQKDSSLPLPLDFPASAPFTCPVKRNLVVPFLFLSLCGCESHRLPDSPKISASPPAMVQPTISTPPPFASVEGMRMPPEFPDKRQRLLRAHLAQIWRKPVAHGAVADGTSVGGLWEYVLAGQDSFSVETDGELDELAMSFSPANPPHTYGEIVDAICARHHLRVSLDARGWLRLDPMDLSQSGE